MIDPTQPPSRSRRHWIAVSLRWTLAVAAVFWLLLLTSAGVLHGFIVPRIGEYRSHVEQLAAKALGTPVRIGALRAHSDGLIPSIEVTDIRLGSEAPQAGLVIPRAWVAISVRSLWRLGVEQLVIESPVLEARRLVDGRWMVAGFVLNPGQSTDDSALEWLLRQPEVAVRSGLLHWQDELRGTPMQTLSDTEFVLHGGRRRQSFRFSVQVKGQEEAASEVVVTGRLQDPLLSSGPVWKRWKGELYIQGALQNLPPLPLPEDLQVQQIQSKGNVRAWFDIAQGNLLGATLDVQLSDAVVAWSRQDLETLHLKNIQGRIDMRATSAGWDLQGKNWAFSSFVSPKASPLMQWHLYWPSQAGKNATVFEASHVDLGQVQQLAQKLPLPETWRKPLNQWQLQGAVEDLDVRWGGIQKEKAQALPYSVKGTLQNVTAMATGHESSSSLPSIENVSGAIAMNDRGGSAQLQIQQGALSFPAVFEEPRIPVDTLTLPIEWQRQNEGGWIVKVHQASFANADAQGTLQAQWHVGVDGSEMPGNLSLQGALSRANGARVYRYLPIAVPKQARDYVRDSVRSGQGRNVQFSVDGALKDFPFSQPGSGTFYIKAPVQQVVFDYVPEKLREPAQPAWPIMSRLSGDLVFLNAGMFVHKAQAHFGTAAQVRMDGIEAAIPDLSVPVLEVSGKAQGALAALLELVHASPIAQLTHHAMERVVAEGNATLQLGLHLPIADLSHSKVKGEVAFSNNRIRFREDVPEMRQVRGGVSFSEKGFELRDAKAIALGGQVDLTGGLKVLPEGVQLDIQGNGRASMDGVVEDGFLPELKELRPYANGETDFAVKVGLEDGVPQVWVSSSMQGVELNLPEPLGKTAAQVFPLEVEYRLIRAEKETAGLARVARVQLARKSVFAYLWDAQNTQTVRSGWLQVGGEVPDTLQLYRMLQTSSSVQAKADVAHLDLDAWLQAAKRRESASSYSDNVQAPWIPQKWDLQADTLQFKGRTLHGVKVQAVQEKGRWKGQVQSHEITGDGAYEPASVLHAEGKVSARLQQLHVPQGDWPESEDSPLASETESAMPALDIEVQDLMLGQQHLGHWKVVARNQRIAQGNRWLLDRLDIALPEAKLQAQGEWMPGPQGKRHTQLQFLLTLNDSGKLLERFGMPGVIRGGTGDLQGHVQWQGSPLQPDWHGMAGQLELDVGAGQFLKVEPGMAKLLSVLSLQSLPRRIGLDFRDVFSSGFAFDFVRGNVAIKQGIARTNNLQMKGVNAAVLMEGKASLPEETQALRVVVVPEINAMTASLVATAINPVVGLSSFLAQALLRDTLVAAGTRQFEITGKWSDPVVQAVPYKQDRSSGMSRAFEQEERAIP